MTLEEELAKQKSFLEMREQFEEARRKGITLPNEVRLPHYQEVMGIMADLKNRRRGDIDKEEPLADPEQMPSRRPAQGMSRLLSFVQASLENAERESDVSTGTENDAADDDDLPAVMETHTGEGKSISPTIKSVATLSGVDTVNPALQGKNIDKIGRAHV